MCGMRTLVWGAAQEGGQLAAAGAVCSSVFSFPSLIRGGIAPQGRCQRGGQRRQLGSQGNTMIRTRALKAVPVSLALFATLTVAASAQERPDAFPSRPIHMIVPFPAGGPSDIV